MNTLNEHMRLTLLLPAAALMLPSSPRSDVHLSAAVMLPPLPSLDDKTALLASHRFSEAANWLIPGHVLLGANPTKGRGSALKRLTPIRCDAGCNTFVNLQEEVPPIDSDDAEALCCPENYASAARECPAEPPVFVRYPIEDLRPAPSMEFLSDCIDDLAERVRSGEVLYIHCFAGRGRTGLIACCLLGALYEGMDAEEALGRVGAYYQTRVSFNAGQGRAADGMSPETEPQREQVRQYFASRSICATPGGGNGGGIGGGAAAGEPTRDPEPTI